MVTKVHNPGLEAFDFTDLLEADQLLLQYALEEAEQAYNPLLNRWAVGVAVRIMQEGIPYLREALARTLPGVRIRTERIVPVIVGSNVEDPDQVFLCECGEGIALAAAQSSRVGDFCEAIAIVGKRVGPEFQSRVLLPCDRCRGRISGYARRSSVGANFKILLGTQQLEEEKVVVTTIGELPPFDANGIDVRTLGG